VILSNGFAFLFLGLIMFVALLFVIFVVTEASTSMRRFALTVLAQSIAMVPQTIPLRVVHILAEKEVEDCTHVVLTLRVPWSG
jgi:hypothetical protein